MQTTPSHWFEQALPQAAHAPVATVVTESRQNEAVIRAQVWSLLSSLYPRVRPIERRRDQRYPYPHLLRLTPADNPRATPLVVAGKNLSAHGISFYHVVPLAVRRVVVSLENGEAGWISFLTDLSWCRFTHHGWYESGGQFIKSVANPLSLTQ